MMKLKIYPRWISLDIAKEFHYSPVIGTNNQISQKQIQRSPDQKANNHVASSKGILLKFGYACEISQQSFTRSFENLFRNPNN